MSPWVDLTMSCNSWDSNGQLVAFRLWWTHHLTAAPPFPSAPFDIVPRPLPDDHLNPVLCFLGKDGMKHLTHP